jgi:hypothetical protein
MLKTFFKDGREKEKTGWFLRKRSSTQFEEESSFSEF